MKIHIWLSYGNITLGNISPRRSLQSVSVYIKFIRNILQKPRTRIHLLIQKIKALFKLRKSKPGPKINPLY